MKETSVRMRERERFHVDKHQTGQMQTKGRRETTRKDWLGEGSE